MEENPNIEVIRRLNFYNRWWETGRVPDALLKRFRRRDFFVAKEGLSKERISILIGPRRVGKTVLMRQIIDSLIREGVPAKRILYAKVDDYLLRTSANSSIEKILNEYSQNILKEPLDGLKERIYVFLDEIHGIDKWEQQMKDFYDLGLNIVFLLTGSSSPAIFRDDSGILTGRYRTQTMLPMKFVDVINLHERKSNNNQFNDAALLLRNSLKRAIESGNPGGFFKDLTESFAGLSSKEDTIGIYLNEYLIKGGYPELYDDEKGFDLEECADLLANQLLAILTKDILSVFEVRNPEKVLNLFQLIGSQTAQIRKYSDMASKLGIIKVDTLKDYLSYLSQTHLIGIAELFSNNIDTTKKSNKKLYVMDVGLRNVSLGLLSQSLTERPDDLGKVAETVVFDHASRLKYNLSPALAIKPIYYWRRNGYEVDIVIPTAKKPIPIEVKFRPKTSKRSLLVFMERFKSPFGILVTKNRLELRDNIVSIPLWLFLLLC